MLRKTREHVTVIGLRTKLSCFVDRVENMHASMPFELVPEDKRLLPMVVFDVKSEYIEEKTLGTLKEGRRYFTLKLRGKLKVDDYVPIQVLGFVNLPLLPVYDGSLGFF